MTLEPVHMKKISEIASEIEYIFVEKESAETNDIFKLLSELRQDDKIILKAVGNLFRSEVDVRRLYLEEDEFQITYSSDSGSTNPILSEKGMFLDICHAAAASTPTNLDLQRKRTIVCAGYVFGKKTKLPNSEWKMFDDEFGKSKMIQIESSLLKIRFKQIVHDYAIYASESEHILWIQKEIDPAGFFIMDGPIYPKQMMYWVGAASDKVLIRHDKNAQKILQNYIDIADFHLENKMPIVGFVKNPAETQILKLVKEKAKEEKVFADFSWATDTQLFKALLKPESDETARFKLTFTNWFLQPDQYYDTEIKTNSPLVAESLNYKFFKEDYTPAFFMVRVPFEGNFLVFKIESLYGLIKDEEMRKRITRKVLYELSAGKIPETLIKADTIAKIGKEEKKEIKELFADEKTYNAARWGDIDEL
jgi:hypothetical protein